jgi:hypothetical protein
MSAPKHNRPRVTGTRKFIPALTRLEDRTVPTLAIMVQSGAFSMTVQDGSPLDTNPLPNQIAVNFTTVPGFSAVNVGLAQTNAPGDSSGASLALSYGAQTNGTAGGTVTITASATGFTSPVQAANPLTLTSQIAGTITGTGSATGQMWADINNGLFGTTVVGVNAFTPGAQGPFSTSPFANSASVNFSRGSGPYSLTQSATLTMATNSQETGSVQGNVPAPTQVTPQINTTQQPATAVVGSSIADKATVSGGNNPTGTVTFKLFNNPNGTGTPLFTDTEPLNAMGMATSAGYTATATGTDYWVATYNGDSNNSSVTSGTALEPVSITPATPGINTQQQPATANVGDSIADKATVTGGFNPTGTVTFRLFDNPNGTGTPLFTDTEPLAMGMATSAGFTATAAGTDYWVATYNGDSNNSKVSSGTADEPVTIGQTGTPVGRGAAATIGYWHNKNGQVLIKSFNGSASSTALGNWLASTFPHLFGAFAGQTNTQIAADFLTAFGNVGGVQGNTYVQAFAVALAIYATDPTLGGGSASSGQGFIVKPGGTGSDTFNVGQSGGAFGVPNGTTLTVLQIMQILDSNYNPATGLFYLGNQGKTSAANQVVDGINSKGDIPQLAFGSTSQAGSGVGELLNPSQILHPGTVLVTFDAAAGGQTSAEDAAIGRAIATINAQFAALGYHFVEVYGADAASADVHIQLAPTSDIGGKANGVLAAYGWGIITMIDGWNWYTGSDPNAVGAGQYDFQTVVTHELGHVIGFGENADPNSVMDLYLARGVARRNFSANDLNFLGTALAQLGYTTPVNLVLATPAISLAVNTVGVNPVVVNDDLTMLGPTV